MKNGIGLNLGWEDVVNAMPNGFVILDRHSIIRFWNSAMELITGYTGDEVLGEQCSILDCDSFHTDSLGVFNKCNQMNGVIPDENLECVIRAKDGTRIPILRSSRVIISKNGNVDGAIFIITDLRPVRSLQEQLSRLRGEMKENRGLAKLIGGSPEVKTVIENIKLAASSNATVLVLGESGTGKELIAEAIHLESTRRNAPLVKVNCSALPETLLESELFGHVKGAFTGAVKDKKGRFEEADNGTIFLDEVGDISALMQLKLLRVIQEHEFERVGESRTRRVDIRIIAATNRDIRKLVAEERFRQDLYYRLNVFQIEAPPLRRRKSDIQHLIDFFINRFNDETGKDIKGLTPEAWHVVMEYCWPGNVRQLENAIEHAFVTCRRDLIGVFDLPVDIRLAELRAEVCGANRRQLQQKAFKHAQKSKITREVVENTLAASGGNKAEAARRLGVTRTTVWRWIRDFGIHKY
ncbi:MAG: sigma 54-interacting transcriptional regulator [Verrucomicrobia bacterium]|nr:sigma 54-interacting transcriptional regulator [Verrucomicrobiota bacterium]